MPEVFSPSRSLKYCFITLRTVEDSSLSRTPPSDLPSVLCLGCKSHLLFVFKTHRAREQLVKKPGYGGELHLDGLKGVHAGAEHGGISKSPCVPADVLTRHPHATLGAVEGV